MSGSDTLSRVDLRNVFSTLHGLNSDENEIRETISQKQIKFRSILELSAPWSHYYEMPYTHLLSLFLITIGIDAAKITSISQSQSVPTMIELFDEVEADLDESNEHDEVADERISIVLSMLMALLGNIWCLKIYSIPLNNLVEKVRGGDEVALFDAVLVDRVAISAPSIARRIQLAQILQDESFFDSLSKAVKRTRPRRPLQHLDDSRFMIEVIDELQGLEAVSLDELFDFLSNDLEIYHTVDEKRDPVSSLNQLIKRRKYHQ